MNRFVKADKQPSVGGAGVGTVPGSVSPERLGEAITLFDDMIRLLDGSIPRQGEATLPGEQLPSLLQQCEQIASHRAAELPWLLLGFPGLPPLSPDWWRHHATGVTLHRLPESGEENAVQLSKPVLRAMQLERAREGRDLFFLATPFADTLAFDPKRTRLIVCHPWRAYMAAGLDLGLSLDGFCSALLARLPEGREALCYDDLGENRQEQAEVLLGRQAIPARLETQEGEAVGYLGGAPAYEALCARFGFDPHRLFGADWPASPRGNAFLAATPGGGAQVSWFLPRIAALLPPEVVDPLALLPQIDAALAADTVPEALDALFSTLAGQDRALAMMLIAAHFTRKGDTMLAMGLVTEALEEVPPHVQALVALGASLYLDLGQGRLALETLASGLRQPGLLAEPQITALDTALYGEAARRSGGQHGHALLMSHLQDAPPLPLKRKRLMVEIGTTRENVPGQGSTRKLALLCQELGLDFVTVDMDPSNSRRAQRMFKRLGLPFKAITAKGEDYLAAHSGPIDYIFLDAYDFDHGNHTEQRQSRYELYLGDRISDAACHQMHLDCAHSLVNILAGDGVICFDDTWTDHEGKWTAKGKTAMPFLLENGFEVTEARNRAALLRRSDS